ncbi:SGNH/GDSL hydrolase family protein [Legionella fairfieldensis]|uniref:SGNH/GDSL hydrolase family protein n=1 Tax=Legionella fairfieldensis TaxID=45064 RepID=UPI00048E2CFF|nr:SGNH/GDSL hydrolase family protein [Legionella fairfieldensis]
MPNRESSNQDSPNQEREVLKLDNALKKNCFKILFDIPKDRWADVPGSSYRSFLINSKVESPLIKRLIFMGDSLSDRGTMEERKLLNIFSMAALSGLKEASPAGRFTNGYVWNDFFLSGLAEGFAIKIARRVFKKDDDIADRIISNDQKLLKEIGQKPAYHVKKRAYADDDICHGKIIHTYEEPGCHDFTLANDKGMRYRGKTWARTNCEGGLTAANYKWKLTLNIPLLFKRWILSNLDSMRKQIMSFDLENGVTYRDKKETLIIEWSGGNDLVTVNNKPAREAVERAVQARINNTRKLLRAGYSHFVIFNQPDISLTPRFQRLSAKQQHNAQTCSNHMNVRIVEEYNKLKEEFPDCTFNIYDVNSILQDIYDHPEMYKFDPAKKTIPYKDSPDFVERDGVYPAPGYMFWDDIHPIATGHAYIGLDFFNWACELFRFEEPDAEIHNLKQETQEDILKRFMRAYRYNKTKNQGLNFFNCSQSGLPPDATLSQVIYQALKGDPLVNKILKRLGLFDKSGRPDCRIPAIAEVFQEPAISQLLKEIACEKKSRVNGSQSIEQFEADLVSCANNQYTRVLTR